MYAAAVSPTAARARTETGSFGGIVGDAATQVAVSVIVPAWGTYSGDPLDAALSSLHAQDEAIQVLVVDNASEPPLEPRPGVEIIRSEHRLTLGAARNLGLSHAESEFVVFWDADDFMLGGTLELLRRRLVAHPDHVAWGLAIIDADTGLRHRWPRRWSSSLHRFPRIFALVNAVWGMYPTTGTTLMRTEAVRAAGGFTDFDSGDDWALSTSLVFHGRVGWDERPGRVYSTTPGSIWARHSTARHLVEHAAEVRRHLRRDRAVPSWARAALPLVAFAQLVAILAASVRRRG